MGNCVKPVDPLLASIPRTTRYDTSAIRESGLPIIFLIGGPGAGKKTQCALVAKHYNFFDIGSREVLRKEVTTGTQRAIVLARIMSQGLLVPSDVLVELIEAKMLSGLEDRARGFLLCGFPREKQQCKLFDKYIRPPDLVLYLRVRNALLLERILSRTVTATERQERRSDEIRRQIKDFGKRSKPILRHYRKKLIVIDGEKDQSDVLQDLCHAIDNVLRNFPGASTARAAN